MDDQTANRFLEATHWPRTAAAAALGMLALFLVVATIKEFKEMRYVGSGIDATNTITVSGEGEVFAVPDIATFSVTVLERANTVEPAQERASEKNNAIVAYLKEQGIAEKDIKTTDYNVYPRYEYGTASCREGYCPPGEQRLVGYEVSQTLTVKVRDTEKAGGLLSGVGSLGASSVSGLSFTVDDEDKLQNEARGLAIEDARTQAAELAKQLNVRLVRIVGFSENGYYPPMPYAARGAAMDMAVAQEAKLAPDLPVGENKIVSNVTVTYEVR